VTTPAAHARDLETATIVRPTAERPKLNLGAAAKEISTDVEATVRRARSAAQGKGVRDCTGDCGLSARERPRLRDRDREHNGLDLAEVLPIRYALASKGIACLARIHGRDPDDLSKACGSLDGVLVPYVEDLEHAKRLAAAAMYRPLKGKALEQVLAGGGWRGVQ
jgi:hypothetical protein